jgi:hypothetical protein
MQLLLHDKSSKTLTLQPPENPIVQGLGAGCCGELAYGPAAMRALKVVAVDPAFACPSVRIYVPSPGKGLYRISNTRLQQPRLFDLGFVMVYEMSMPIVFGTRPTAPDEVFAARETMRQVFHVLYFPARDDAVGFSGAVFSTARQEALHRPLQNAQLASSWRYTNNKKIYTNKMIKWIDKATNHKIKT